MNRNEGLFLRDFEIAALIDIGEDFLSDDDLDYYLSLDDFRL